MLNVGVLALQGAFREHISHVRRCGHESFEVRRPQQLDEADALIIPGGESTTIGKLMVAYDLVEPVKTRARAGMPILGTCAGAILLSRTVTDGDQPLLQLMDIEVRRNAFGRQRDSFEADLTVAALGGEPAEPLRAVFIRAPWIEKVGRGVEILATIDGHIVAARQGNYLATAFHPELTDDLRLHRYFIDRGTAAMARPA